MHFGLKDSKQVLWPKYYGLGVFARLSLLSINKSFWTLSWELSQKRKYTLKPCLPLPNLKSPSFHCWLWSVPHSLVGEIMGSTGDVYHWSKVHNGFCMTLLSDFPLFFMSLPDKAHLWASVLQRGSSTVRGAHELQSLRGLPTLAQLAPVGWSSLQITPFGTGTFLQSLWLCCLQGTLSSTSPSVSLSRASSHRSPCASSSPWCLQVFHK